MIEGHQIDVLLFKISVNIIYVSKLEKWTIGLNTIFNFGSVLVANFISVYLYVYTKSIPMMSLYIIVRIGLFPVFFALGYYLSKKHSFTVTYILGLSLITLALVYALLAGPLFEINPYYVLIAAAIVGSGEGFYYFSANTCNQIVSKTKTRNIFFSYNGIFNNITSLMAPVYATFMLSLSKDEMMGYKRILVSIIIVFVVVIGFAFKINKRSEDKGSSLIKALSFKDKVWRDHSIAVFIYGLRNALELNTINLLIYNASKNGTTYSKLNIVFSIITIVTFRVIVNLLNRENMDRTFKLGVFIKIISTLILVFIPNMIGAIIYGVLNALATVLYDNSYNVLSANIIGLYKEEMTSRVVARETYLSIGRCLAMAFIILCYQVLPSDMYLQVSVVALAFTPIFVERILIRYK